MIERAEVLHVARLARLKLAEEEVEALRRDLSEVLSHVAKIGEVAAAEVPPTAHVALAEAHLRADEPQPSLSREVALGSAPAREGEFFLVPSPQA